MAFPRLLSGIGVYHGILVTHASGFTMKAGRKFANADAGKPRMESISTPQKRNFKRIIVKTLEQVRTQLSAGEFEFTRHAFMRIVERNISEQDITQAGIQANIIEEYANDKYSPSYLLLGFTQTGKPLHIQISLTDTYLVRIITVYEPDPREWSNHSTRR